MSEWKSKLKTCGAMNKLHWRNRGLGKPIFQLLVVASDFVAQLCGKPMWLLTSCWRSADSPQVLSVFPSRLRKLHTTRSWEFLGLVNESGKVPNYSLWKKSKFGKNVVVGLFDSGKEFRSWIRYFQCCMALMEDDRAMQQPCSLVLSEPISSLASWKISRSCEKSFGHVNYAKL